MAIESSTGNTPELQSSIAIGHVFNGLRSNRWVRLLDLALPITAGLLFFTDQTVLFFHMIFMFLTLGAFWWKFRGFVLRSIFWVTINTTLVLRAVSTGQTQAEELIEIPLLTIILLMVYAVARQRANAERSLQRSNDHLEMRVEERTVALRNTNRELNNFVSVAAHNLQEPLRKIQVSGSRLKSYYSDISIDDESSPVHRMRDSAEQMHESARQMSDLIDDIRAFSEVSNSTLQLVPVDLGESARQALLDLKASIDHVDGKIELAELPTIEADPKQMRFLFNSIVGNALKFRRPEEPLVVKISNQELDGRNGPSHEDHQATESCRFTVEDNGIGFEQKHLDRIFTIFQTVHDPSEYSGNGAGLTICRKIVERHGGTITAESTLGKGTKLIITLPMASR